MHSNYTFATIPSLPESDCRFCQLVVNADPSSLFDTPLVTTENFVVVPSVGSLVPNWLLIVPKPHCLSLASMPETLRPEFLELKNALVTTLARGSDGLWLFEHGPAAAKRQSGCGVDHAHLHVVLTGIDLVAAAQPFLPPGVAFKRGTLDDCLNFESLGCDYLYAERLGYSPLVAGAERLGSQIFRKAIAAAIGEPDKFDWREHPRPEVARHTVAHFAAQSRAGFVSNSA